ncbi:formimidoylglutamate deiminase [Caulobacter sp. S45]|uniref:formimidoylglutamate deiminase n=1 Tax=Caulobacter sp. S45 TaxID=1641861 RepID=UPI0020B1676B|nr:formimidoylglutamate deiminase [Caulobacter sp. S45]
MTEAHFFFDQALTPAGWASQVRMSVRDGLIVTLEPGSRPAPGDRTAAIGLPGLGNLHSHAFQRAMAGLTEISGSGADSFWTWREVMYRFLGRLDPEAVQAIAAMAQVEMLESGFTRVGEFHYLHHDVDGAPYEDPAEMGRRLAAAAQESGIGLTLLPVFYAHSGFGGAAPSSDQKRFLHTIDGYARLLEASRAALEDLPDGVLGIAPHSLRAVTPQELAAITPLADGGPIHIHVAEQLKEVEDSLAVLGRRPVRWLLDHAQIDERWCFVHATHLDDDEVQALARSGATAGLCPVTEANLGDGVFPADLFLAAGGVFGVGSDSNVSIDVAEELRLLEYGQRLTRHGRAVLAGGPKRSTGANLYKVALCGGARALDGAEGLVPGASADFLTLDPEHPSLVGRRGDALLDSWIFGGARAAIDGVWRRGRQVVAGGRHLGRATIAASYAATLRRLLD